MAFGLSGCQAHTWYTATAEMKQAEGHIRSLITELTCLIVSPRNHRLRGPTVAVPSTVLGVHGQRFEKGVEKSVCPS